MPSFKYNCCLSHALPPSFSIFYPFTIIPCSAHTVHTEQRFLSLFNHLQHCAKEPKITYSTLTRQDCLKTNAENEHEEQKCNCVNEFKHISEDLRICYNKLISLCCNTLQLVLILHVLYQKTT